MTDTTTNGVGCDCLPLHNVRCGWHTFKCLHHTASSQKESEALQHWKKLQDKFNRRGK